MPSGCRNLTCAHPAGSSCPRTRRPAASAVQGKPPALAVELDGVAPQHLVDVVLGEPRGEHRVTGLAGLERIALAPVGGRVHQHPLGAVLAKDRDHPVLVHLRVRIDREAHPAARILDHGDGHLVEVVEHHALGRDPRLADHGDAALGPGGLVAVRRVHQRRQVVVDAPGRAARRTPCPPRRSSSRSRSRRPRRRRPSPGSAAAGRAPARSADRWPPWGSARSCSGGRCRTGSRGTAPSRRARRSSR